MSDPQTTPPTTPRSVQQPAPRRTRVSAGTPSPQQPRRATGAHATATPRGTSPAKDVPNGTTKGRYIPALDGLRALAVLAVIAYHMGMNWAPGGLLGVTVFFVLSGYLITSLLLIEWDNTRTINLPQFWLRRVRRLFPAIVFVIVCTAVLCILFDHSLLTKLREDMWAALLWFSNWWYIFHDISYFDALGAPSPLTHFWSLAIEEQFYLLWPVVLLIAHKLGVKRTTMRNATLVLALLSAVEMAVLFNPSPGADPSRVYYGTDTRAFSLLIGAWLAFVWPSHLLGAHNEVQLGRQARTVLDGVGVVALVGLLALMAFVDGFAPFLYRGGLLLASVLTAVIIAVMVHPSSILGRAAGWAPFVWIGKRSYGIYLWHFPLLLLMNPRNFTGETPWWMYLVQLAVIFACAMFSYRFVENPIRHGALGAFVKNVRAGQIDIPDWLQTHAIPAGAAVLVTVVAVGGLVFVPPTSAIGDAALLEKQASDAEQSAQAASQAAELASAQAGAEAPKLDVLMVGDSVSVRAIPVFNETFPYGFIDAAVNRQFYVGADVYNQYKEQNVVGDVVVFALGTNGVVTDEQLDELVASVGSDKQIFFMNTRSPQTWEADTNAAMAEAPSRYGNVHAIDWYGASADHDDYFDGDGTHLTEEGAQAYIGLIHDAIAPYLPTHEAGAEAAVVKSPVELASESVDAAVKDALHSMAGKVVSAVDTTK